MTVLNGIYADTPLNTSEIPQVYLDIENKSRSNPLPWNGQFSPQLIQVLLSKYAPSKPIILDPFVGSGTVLLEASRAGIKAIGVEINPAAVALARIYSLVNISPNQRELFIGRLENLLRNTLPDVLPLFRNPNSALDSELIKAELIELWYMLEEFAERILLEALIVLADFYKPGLTVERIYQVWNRLVKLLRNLPISTCPIQVFHADARSIPLEDGMANLVLTSPPYINVFNYHQRYRASVEALRWDILKVAKSEIGANRKHRGNRFLTVIQFCLDIAQTLKELLRVCQPDSRIIFVVGRESVIRGTAFFNGEIVAEIANRSLGCGMNLRQERVFLNRYGQNIYEDILHFRSPGKLYEVERFLDRAREVARRSLEMAYSTAPAEAKGDIKSALANIDDVSPSPLFDLSKAIRPSIKVNHQVAAN